MSEDPQTPEGPPADVAPAPPQTPEGPPAGPPPRSGLAAALPFIATAVAAVLLSLLAQSLLPPRQAAAPPTPAPTLAPPTPAPTLAPPTPAPSATPGPDAPTAAPIPAESALRLDILDLEEEDRQLWSALYLLRAAAQIDDAVAALQVNDLDEADRTLLIAYRSLDRAYASSAEQEKGPIDTFRRSLSQIRDDLRLRPEGADRRLRQLRSLVLSLVDEGA